MTPSYLHIQRPGADALSKLGKLFEDCFSEPPWNESFSPGEGAEFLTTLTEKSDNVFVVATHESEVVGCAVGYNLIGHADVSEILKKSRGRVDDIFYAAELFVKKEFRGQSVARALYEKRKAIAQVLGYSKFCVRTSVNQPAIQAIYQKDGFYELTREQTFSKKLIDGVVVDAPDERVIFANF